MLIKREDSGNVKELTKGSNRKVWIICDKCGIGILKKYCFYLRQKYGDLCQKCTNKLISKDETRRKKLSESTKKTFKNEEYKRKHSEKIKKVWKNKEYREKQSKSSKERWKNKEYRKNHSNYIKKAWKDEKYKNHGEKIRKLFKSKEYKKNRSNILKEIFSNKKYDFKLDEKKLKKRCEHNNLKYIERRKIESRTYIVVKCRNNHITIKEISSIKNTGCKICSKSISKAEKEIAEYLKSLNINIIENDRSIIHPLELDIVIPSHKLAIEYCGLYWHSYECKKDRNYHKNKLEKTNQAGYRLITIFEDEWLYKKEIAKNRLKYFLKLNTQRIYARKCTIREISKEQAREFVDKYHIQGNANATIYLGAFYNMETGFGFKIPKLIAVNTFINKGNLSYELNRFCVNINIMGIASKFLKYFQRNYEWNKIYTFADLRWSEGHLYEKIGFKKDKILKPDYSYFDNSNNKNMRYHKFGFRHSRMKNKLKNYNPELSERENMLNNNYYRIYDCGKVKYSIKNDSN